MLPSASAPAQHACLSALSGLRTLTGKDWKRLMANCSLQKGHGKSGLGKLGAGTEGRQDVPVPEPSIL
jgi:hypothetical protein